MKVGLRYCSICGKVKFCVYVPECKKFLCCLCRSIFEFKQNSMEEKKSC